MSAFRDFLEEQRVARGYTVPAFAEFLGISDTTLRNFVHKTKPTMPNLATLLKIVEKTKVPFEELVERLEPEAAERIRRSSGRIQFFAEKMGELDDDQVEAVLALIDTYARQNQRRK